MDGLKLSFLTSLSLCTFLVSTCEFDPFRQHVFHELVQTETNYVNILRTILEVFKKPLEDPNQAGGELLNATEMRIVFGNLPPIYDVHAAMLEEFQKVHKSIFQSQLKLVFPLNFDKSNMPCCKS